MGAARSGGGAGDPGLGVAPRWGGPIPAPGTAGGGCGVGYALAGKPLDDAGMLEVLAPYLPQRHRAVRYVAAAGFRRPRFGPRLSFRDYRAM